MVQVCKIICGKRVVESANYYFFVSACKLFFPVRIIVGRQISDSQKLLIFLSVFFYFIFIYIYTLYFLPNFGVMVSYLNLYAFL